MRRLLIPLKHFKTLFQKPLAHLSKTLTKSLKAKAKLTGNNNEDYPLMRESLQILVDEMPEDLRTVTVVDTEGEERKLVLTGQDYLPNCFVSSRKAPSQRRHSPFVASKLPSDMNDYLHLSLTGAKPKDKGGMNGFLRKFSTALDPTRVRGSKKFCHTSLQKLKEMFDLLGQNMSIFWLQKKEKPAKIKVAELTDEKIREEEDDLRQKDENKMRKKRLIESIELTDDTESSSQQRKTKSNKNDSNED